MITRLRDLDPRAGTFTFPRDTNLMHNFNLYDTLGRLIRNTNHEAHEQYVVHYFLAPVDKVIELGGGIGANSIQINMTLKGRAKSSHYVFEPQRILTDIIEQNRKLNSCKFNVIHGVLSKNQTSRVPKYNPDKKKWIFVRAGANENGPIVPSVNKLPIIPTAIVADCEGCLLQVLQDFPEILNKIRMVYVENDGGSDVFRGIRDILLARGMHQVINTVNHKLFLMG